MSYFVRITNRVVGPFDEVQLLEMKSRGKISSLTEISENNRSDWQRAESFPFLYETVRSNEPDHPAGSNTSNTYSLSSPPAYGTADWFYSMNGTEGHGPVTAATIEQMLWSQQLNGNSFVWQQGQNARLIRNEQRFSHLGDSTNSVPAENTGSLENIGAKIFRRVAASLDSTSDSASALSRHTFICLAAFPFTGAAGIHDFYAKRDGLGAVHIVCLVPWIFLLLFVAISTILGSLGIHVNVDWFDSFSPGMHSPNIHGIERTGNLVLLCFIVLPFVSYVMAMTEIVVVTKDGRNRELKRS